MNDNRPDVWHLQTQSDVPGLITALQHHDPIIRMQAAAALKALGAADAAPALRVALASEQDPTAYAAMAAAVAVLTAAPHRLNQLILTLRHKDLQQALDSARRLGELGDRRAVAPLITLFNDPNTNHQLRLATAEALLNLEPTPVKMALLAALRHADWRIRRNGAAIMGQLRADWAVDPLSRALDDAHQVVQRTARAALQHIATPHARRALARMQMRQTDTASAVQPAPAKASSGHSERLVAPRNGLLRHVQSATSPSDDVDQDVPSYLNPTLPLDPDKMDAFLTDEDDE